MGESQTIAGAMYMSDVRDVCTMAARSHNPLADARIPWPRSDLHSFQVEKSNYSSWKSASDWQFILLLARIIHRLCPAALSL